MKKIILRIFITSLIFISCKNKNTEQIDDSIVEEVSTIEGQADNVDGLIVFNFQEPENEYKIKVFWFPREVINGTGEVTGSAIIKLQNINSNEIKTITTDHFVPYRNSIENNDISIKQKNSPV